jgi:uncharacterized protein YjbI with pentapeptide repeats
MANDEHVEILKKGVAAWNDWRQQNPDIEADLIISDANLNVANPNVATLNVATLNVGNLTGANLTRAKLARADLTGAYVKEANLMMANLVEANLTSAYLRGANLTRAKLARADLREADLTNANLTQANLTKANLTWADLTKANLTKATLTNAILNRATLVDTDLTGADLTGCHIYGISAWGLKLEGAKQQNLIITPEGEPAITVDDIEVAQFIYLMLNNQKIRQVIDTITSKAVLILGRFTDERKAVLDALREELRKHDYLPILFDFDKPTSQDLTATVSTLAHLARFVIADITDPSSIPYELATVVPTTPVPVQPILLSGSSEFEMFPDLRRRHHWVLTTHRYASEEQLIVDLGEKVIRPAELKVQDLRGGAGQ